ncbi:LysR substrate-binding domain-containing protein [Agrobacterium tumefaciens]|jgi:DNA-binding transcriptional LysR family regulator|uniref:LysR family transcriptional regulator n=1 Tax=Rhizobium TaxID=379 RepID=UPI00021700B7|nr:LysR family transcriptional regulator [Rhizobium sp. X9]EGP56781.1 LysR family transcriptional regulator [Agrobacterium tumefaciens F2]QCM05158.1 LysR family transcriptional regulator [Agrobacterium tumefaciens]CUX07788.1 putative transcriptional regulatory protein, LysR family; putative OprD regulatory protein [Agrobacterium genomosp. 5 str. CFBP 6626]HBT69023.1 LysR family transcriptional regulator [Agrobacterium sp.]WKL21394.1 LysR substrate-binding domain-containing protein [Agrobacteri
MPQENFNDLAAFVTVAREQSFTRAAVKLGVSQSALSQTVRGLEERLGLRLLTRTTRRVSPTAAGERLLQTAGPRFDEIQSELSALSDMRDKPAGTVRITAGEHAAISVLAPALDKILPNYPDINVEITVDYGLTDIVAERYDAGVRLGEQLAKDMIAVKIAPEMRMAVVGAPSYFRQNPWPEVPEDLTAHNCIQIRMPTYGNILFWEFEKDGHELKVRVEGQLVFNNIAMRLDAAKRGLGLAYMPEDIVAEDIAKGTLIRVLEDWCAPFSGYHLYYPNRRHASPAFALVVDALRYRG